MVEADATGLLLSGFGLTTMARQLEDIEERAQAGGWSFRRTLRELLETEAAERGQRRLLRLLKDSGLPEGKTLAALEESRLSAATRRQLAELCEGHFVECAVNVLAFGLPGRGKTQKFPPNACRGERCGVWGRTAPIKPVRSYPHILSKNRLFS